jgi:hypothetical protein
MPSATYAPFRFFLSCAMNRIQLQSAVVFDQDDQELTGAIGFGDAAYKKD